MLCTNSSFISTYEPEHTLSCFCGNGSEPGDRHTPKPDGYKLGYNSCVAVIGGRLHTSRVGDGD